MDYEIQSIMRKDTWGVVSRKPVADHNVLPGTLSFKCKRKPDWTIRKFKARYCVIGDCQKILFPEPLNSYSPMVQWVTVRLMLILQCVLVLHSQHIDFKNAFAWSDIPSGEPVFIEIPRDFNSYGRQFDVVFRLNKILYSQAEAPRLWYEKLRMFLLDCGFVLIKLYPCMFMPNTFICVVYVDDCLFWERSKSDIYNVIKSLKEDGPIYNWEHSKVE